MKTFKSIVEIQKDIERKCNNAIEGTCKELNDVLQEFANDSFYSEYSPSVHKRTYQLFNMCTHEMVSDMCGKVFLDSSLANYQGIDSALNLDYMVNGIHGNPDIQTEGRFFQDFLNYCDKNAINILVKNLRKQGLNIVKM